MKALRYAKRLIGFDSTSHLSNRRIAKYLEMKLTKHGFVVEVLEYEDENNVRKVNVVAKKGNGKGGLAYFAHSDVVPAEKWFTKKFTPFQPAIARERLYGRGACDMKGSIACMLAAAQRVSWDALKSPFYFCVTADEEVGFRGARCVAEDSSLYREMVEHKTRGIIGEPTSMEIVHAHKGSIEIIAKAKGKMAHSGSHVQDNANLKMIPFLTEMKAIFDETENESQWRNEMFDPPTLSPNILVKDNSPARNITPSRSVATVYLRAMPAINHEPLLQRIAESAQANNLKLKVIRQSEPFFVDPSSEFVQQMLQIVHKKRPYTVPYGTDGGVFTEIEEKVVCGPGSIDQAHTANEWISLEQLHRGTDLYEKMIRHWCCS
jgi:acetylornithine deacetylase